MMLGVVGADRWRFPTKGAVTRSSALRSGRTAAPIEMRFGHDVGEVLEQLQPEFGAAV